ncbi:MAG: PD-(D/E)XK nuclease family protein [Aminivibrio sp.]
MLHFSCKARRRFALHIHTYRNPSHIAPLLAERAAEPGRMFLVPSNRDKPLLLDMLLAGEGGVPGGFLGRDERQRGGRVWDDLYRALLEAAGGKPRAQIDPPDHWLLLRRIVKALRERFPDKLPPGVFSDGFIELVGQSVRELLREDVTPAGLAGSLMCGECPDEDGCLMLDDESGILCRIFRDYTALLEELGLSDSAQIPSLGADLLASSPGAAEFAKSLSITAAGFLSFASGQLRLVRGLMEAGADMEFFVPECGEGQFYTVLDQFPEARAVRLESGPTPSLSLGGGDLRLASDTLARELVFWSHGAGRLKKAAAMDFPGWSAIAVCGDDSDLASAMESFERYGLPFCLREGVLVSETVLWKSALRAVDLASEGWPAGETANFLSGLLFSPFDFPREAFAQQLPSGREEWTRFLNEQGGSLSASFLRALAFTDAVAAGRDPASLISALADLAPDREGIKRLITEGAPYPSLDGDLRVLNDALLEAREKERALRDLDRDLGPAGKDPLSGGEAIAFLERWAETAYTRTSPPVTPAVSLHPGAPPTLAWAPVWILLGAAASRWPGQIRESPLLNDERKAVLHDSLGLGASHLPLAPEKRRQREALFRRLSASATELCLFVYPLADGSGRPLPPSPFIGGAETGKNPWLLPTDEPIERSLGEMLPGEGEPLAEGVEIWAQSGGPLGIKRGNPSEAVLAGHGDVFYLSSLDDYADCPFFYYCRRAGLEPVREELFLPLKAGNGYHRLWELAWEEYILSGGSLAALARRHFDQAYGEAYPELLSHPGLARRRLDQLNKNIRLGAMQDELEINGLRSARAGQKREHPLPEMEIGGISFRGRCDRLDMLEGNTYLIFDYKSGRADRYNKSLQLAAYSLALKEEFGGRGAAAAIYLSLADGGAAIARSEDAPSWIKKRKAALPGLEEEAANAMNRAAESVRTGIWPPNYDSDRCKYCPFPSLCRKRDFRPETTREED